MDKELRGAFNDAFDDRLARRYRDPMEGRLGPIGFPVAATPLFLPADFRRSVEEAAIGIVDQLSDPVLVAQTGDAVPSRWGVPGIDHLPGFAQLDFAVAEENGALVPRLIELQGFPSLGALQIVQHDCWSAALEGIPGLDRRWSSWFSGLDRAAVLDLLRRTITGSHDPAEVVVVDLDPQRQRTRADFEATRQLFGVEAVDPRELTVATDASIAAGRGSGGSTTAWSSTSWSPPAGRSPSTIATRSTLSGHLTRTGTGCGRSTP